MPGTKADRLGSKQFERRGKAGNCPKWHWYRTCGLTIRSQLEVPELAAIEPPPDDQDLVEIILGNVPSKLANGEEQTPWLQTNDRQCVIGSPNIARYLIEDGNLITVDRRFEPSSEYTATGGDIRTYLLGTVLGALLHQRQWLPLHISAVKTDRGVVAFTGPSGAGKSTLTACLHYWQGLPLITDDLAVLRPDDRSPLLYPGPPRLKLWTSALERLGLSKGGLVRDLAREDKFHLHQNLDFQSEPARLDKLVLLTRTEPGQATFVRRIRGIEAYRVFMHSIYRRALCHLFFNQARLHDFGGIVVSRIEVYEYRRPWDLTDLEREVRQLSKSLSLTGEH